MTTYYTTVSMLCRPARKVIDLNDYRPVRRPQPERETACEYEDRLPHAAAARRRPARHVSRSRAQAEHFHNVMDILASCAVIFMTVSIGLQCLL